MSRSYPFLDPPAEYFIRQNHGIRVYCRCGHHELLTPEGTFARRIDLSLHGIVARLRCKKCNRLGDIECVTVSPMDGPVGGCSGR